MKKPKAKKPQFPKNSRFIPESFSHYIRILKNMTVIFTFASLLVFGFFLFFDLYLNYVNFSRLSLERQKLISEVNTWESFSQKYPNYKEVYFQIAVREFELGDYQSSIKYLQKALFIDPNYQDALKLKKELESR